MAKFSVLMVCTANICRSPMAQGMLQGRLEEAGMHKYVKVDSAGTRVARSGLKPDQRAQAVCSENGIDIRGYKSRPVGARDFSRQQLIICMDDGHMKDLIEICPGEHCHKLEKIVDFIPGNSVHEVPDPYYGNVAGFQTVFEILTEATQGIVVELERRLS